MEHPIQIYDFLVPNLSKPPHMFHLVKILYNYGHLSVITGDFYRIIHSIIHGIFSVIHSIHGVYIAYILYDYKWIELVIHCINHTSYIYIYIYIYKNVYIYINISGITRAITSQHVASDRHLAKLQ